MRHLIIYIINIYLTITGNKKYKNIGFKFHPAAALFPQKWDLSKNGQK